MFYFYFSGRLHEERSLKTVTNLNASKGMFQLLCSAKKEMMIVSYLFFPGTSVSLDEGNKLPKRPAQNYIMKIYILLLIIILNEIYFNGKNLRCRRSCE